jgi:O-antigen ligase
MIFYYLLVSIMPLVNHPIWSRFVGELTLTKFVGVACLLYAIWHRVARRSIPNVLGSWVTRLFVLFYLLAVVSYYSKGFQEDWKLSSLFSYTSFLFLLFVTAAVVDSLPRLRTTLFVAIGAVAFASLYVIREWQLYHHLYDGYRPGFITGDPNYFTLSAVVCLPLAYYLMLEAQTWWGRAFCLGCMLVTLVAVIMAASRGGFLGLFCALLFIVWRSPRRIRNFVLMAAFLVPLVLIVPSSPVRRFLHPDYGDVQGKDTRLELWRAGMQMIRQNPLTGVGLGNFKRLVTQYEGSDVDLEKIAHNTYIEIAAEMGIPSLLVFLCILFAAYRTLSRVHKNAANPSFYFTVATAMQAGLVGCVVSIMFISCEKQKFLWFLVFLVPCLESLAFAAEPEKIAEPQPVAEFPEEGGNYDMDREELEVTQWS